MKQPKGAPGVGTPGSADDVQQIGGIGEQVDCSSDTYCFQKEFEVIESALIRIFDRDEIFADHRRGLVDCPYFGFTTGKFNINVNIVVAELQGKRDVGRNVADLPGEC